MARRRRTASAPWDSMSDAVVASLSFLFASSVSDRLLEKLKTQMPTGPQKKRQQETLLFLARGPQKEQLARQRT